MVAVENCELGADIAELKTLLAQASRSSVRNIIAGDISRLEAQLAAASSAAGGAQAAGPKVVNTPAPAAAVNTLLNYAWDQSDKFVKIYVTFKDSSNVKNEDIKFECTDDGKSHGVSVFITQAGKNYAFNIKELAEEIVSKDSYFKIKSDDMILLMLRKASVKSWEAVTLAEQRMKEKNKPKMDEKADPQAGIMNMMKQMYDEGDDEMKRSIKKAWVESQDKKAKGGGDDFSMPMM